MDPNLSNPNDQAAPTANVVVPSPVVPPPQSAPQAPPPAYSQNPQVQPIQPPIQNTSPPAPIANPISQSQASEPPPDTNFDGLPKKHFISKKFVTVAVVLFLAVSIPLTVFVANQQQNTKSGAANTITDATVVGSFNGHPFTVGDITLVALENYSQDQLLANNHDALTLARDTYVERQVLDKAETDLGLTVTPDQIDSLANDTGLNQLQAKYELLKQQVILKQVNYVKAVSIGYWLPPDDAGQNYASGDQPIITKQDQEGKTAMDQATSAFNNGQDVLTIANSISTDNAYTDLAPVLSMNGSKFALIPDADKQTAAEPVLYEYGGTNFDDQTKNTLFTAPKDTVITSVADQSSGGKVVFKIIDKGTGTLNSYSDWLSQQEANLYTKVTF